MFKELTINNYNVQITTGDLPSDARLVINGKNIPLIYHEGFRGWGVEHTIYGFFQNLEKLAEHMIYSNPELRIGHGGEPEHDHDDHSGGHRRDH